MFLLSLLQAHREGLAIQRRKRSELEALQRRKLRALAAHCAARSPYYREMFAEHRIDPAGSDIEDFPQLDKARVVIVPVVNPDGFNLSRTLGYEMKRKNCRVTNGQIPTTGQCSQSSNQSRGTAAGSTTSKTALRYAGCSVSPHGGVS